jgi:hypothetical protein
METKQAFAHQPILLGREIDVLVYPPARQAVGIAVAETDRTAALEQDAEDGDEQEPGKGSVHGATGGKAGSRVTPTRSGAVGEASVVSFRESREDTT